MKRLLLSILLLAAFVLPAAAQERTLQVLSTRTITTALTGIPFETLAVPPHTCGLTFKSNFVYGSGGTTAKAWVQTTFDKGVSWVDIASFAFTTTSGAPINSVRVFTVVAANYTPTDGTLADNTIKDGLIGTQLRVKLTTTGTYAGSTTLRIDGVANLCGF